MPQVLLIEPLQFGEIVTSPVLVNTIQTKSLNELVHRKHFAVITGVPAQQSQKINISLRKIAGLPITGGFITCFGVGPLRRIKWETQTIPVPFG